MWKLLTVLAVTFLSISSVWSKLPADIKKCSPSDKNCILNNINHIFQNKLNGDPEFGLINMQPMHLGDLEINQDRNSPIGGNYTIKDIKLYGIENARAIKIKGFGPTPDGVHEILIKSPKMSLVGNYKINGKILILPVVGEGIHNITFTDYIAKITFGGKSLIKDGQVYLDVVSFDYTTTIGRFYSHMDNLFNGDKALGDQFNEFTNQEWEVLEKEFHKPLDAAADDYILKLIKSVFSSTPYSEIFNISK